MCREASILVLGSRWWCEQCERTSSRRELRLDVHFDGGHIGVGLYISSRPVSLVRSYLRSYAAQTVERRSSTPASTEFKVQSPESRIPILLPNAPSVFQRVEGARLPACESNQEALPARCTL